MRGSKSEGVEPENQEKYGRAALDFELSKTRIDAEAKVRTEAARAFPAAFSKMGVQVWGGKDMATDLFGQLTKGLGYANLVNGFLDGSNETARAAIGQVSDTMLNSLSAAVEKLTGKTVPRARLREILTATLPAEAEDADGEGATAPPEPLEPAA